MTVQELYLTLGYSEQLTTKYHIFKAKVNIEHNNKSTSCTYM